MDDGIACHGDGWSHWKEEHTNVARPGDLKRIQQAFDDDVPFYGRQIGHIQYELKLIDSFRLFDILVPYSWSGRLIERLLRTLKIQTLSTATRMRELR